MIMLSKYIKSLIFLELKGPIKKTNNTLQNNKLIKYLYLNWDKKKSIKKNKINNKNNFKIK